MMRVMVWLDHQIPITPNAPRNRNACHDEPIYRVHATRGWCMLAGATAPSIDLGMDLDEKRGESR